MAHDEDLIRDDDLRQQLEAARGKSGFDVYRRGLIAAQSRRDTDAANAALPDHAAVERLLSEQASNRTRAGGRGRN